MPRLSVSIASQVMSDRPLVLLMFGAAPIAPASILPNQFRSFAALAQLWVAGCKHCSEQVHREGSCGLRIGRLHFSSNALRVAPLLQR